MTRMSQIVVIIALLASLKQTGAQDTSTVIPGDTVLGNGWVIAYGELLKRPYVIGIVNDTICINNVPFSPSLHIPAPPADSATKTITPTELGQEFVPRMLPFQTRCGELYAEWFSVYGEDSAKNRLVVFLDTQRVVNIREYTINRGALVIKYNYKFGELFHDVTPLLEDSYLEETILLSSWVFAHHKKAKTVEEEQHELSMRQRSEFENIVCELNMGWLLYFEHGREKHESADEADGIIAAIRKAMALSLSDSEIVEEIRKVLRIPPRSAAEFIKHRDSWEEN